MSFSEKFKNKCKKYDRGQALIDIIEDKLNIENGNSHIIYDFPEEFKNDIIALETLKKALDECGFCEVNMKNKTCINKLNAPKYMYFFYIRTFDYSSEEYVVCYTNDIKNTTGISIST